ncbi:MAG: hypothetical protein CFE21_07800 [Bacteroidetes bacterium B1(2017)]|nr:MAG: hypothetical protein CFE21_07800 [Bacteroidetes bacterium B1(2017)]
MSGGKVSVRQKMINMMYLVLTALLALNVSAEILKSFHMVEVSMDRAGANIDEKNKGTLKAIEKYNIDLPNDKVGKEAYDKSLAVKKIADEGVAYFAKLKDELITAAGGRKDGNPEEEIAQASNIELHANLMINQGKGAEVKAKINEIRTKLMAFVPTDKQGNIKSDLTTPEPKDSKESWEGQMFEHTPLAAVVALLSKTQNDIKNTESQVLDYIRQSIIGEVTIVDNFSTEIIPISGTNVTVGSDYEAKIFLAASSSRSNPDIKVNGQALKIENGVGVYKSRVTSEGEKEYNAVITTTNSSGKSTTYTAKGKYFALAPLAVISATKMNVVYIGLQNPISVSVPGFSANKVEVRCQGGNLKKVGSGGEFELTVDGSSKLITIIASVDGKVMGQKEYRVRQIPKPTPMLGDIEQSGGISMGRLRLVSFVGTPLKDFVFEGVKFTPSSYTLIVDPKTGNPQVFSGTSSALSPQAMGALRNVRPGDRVYLMKLRAKGPAGEVNIPTSLALEVSN